MNETSTRVALGAAVLDEYRPDWAYEIDSVTLDMADPAHCIIGQLYGGNYTTPMENLAALDGMEDEYNACLWAERNGFDVDMDNSYEELQKAWRLEIAERMVVR